MFLGADDRLLVIEGTNLGKRWKVPSVVTRVVRKVSAPVVKYTPKAITSVPKVVTKVTSPITQKVSAVIPKQVSSVAKKAYSYGKEVVKADKKLMMLPSKMGIDKLKAGKDVLDTLKYMLKNPEEAQEIVQEIMEMAASGEIDPNEILALLQNYQSDPAGTYENATPEEKQVIARYSSSIKPASTIPTNYILYGGLALAGIMAIYFITRKGR